jgi:hypothetical protein
MCHPEACEPSRRAIVRKAAFRRRPLRIAASNASSLQLPIPVSMSGVIFNGEKGWFALVKRAGNDVLGVGPQPQIVGDDLNDVADQLIARHKGRA